MDKQIAEMARDMDYGCVKRDLYPDDAKEIAKALYLLGYRKIHDGAVVLTREEYEAYTFIKHKYGNQDAIKWSDLVDGLYEFARVFSKETAEKFAEMVLIEYGAFDDKDKISLGELRRDINGILKGFTGGGKNDG